MDANERAAEQRAEDSPARREAREAVSQRLALISMIVWVVGILGFMFVLYPGRPWKPSSGMLVALVMMGVAALPWLAYRPLVERRLRGADRA